MNQYHHHPFDNTGNTNSNNSNNPQWYVETVDDMQDLPPIPALGATGPEVCDTIQLYLSVLNDLPPAQVEAILQHVRACPDCAAQYQILKNVTTNMQAMQASAPSAQVDRAVMAAIASRVATMPSPPAIPVTPPATPVVPARSVKPRVAVPIRSRRRAWSSLRGWSQIAAALILLVGVLAVAHYITGSFSGPQNGTGFSLPQNLTWSAYVVYHSETRIAADGERYLVNTYHNIGSGETHVETMMGNTLDIVAISDGTAILGLDMLRHIAQWDAKAWSVDPTEEFMFNLPEMRRDLASGDDTYIGTDVFHGEKVYRLRCKNNLVILLDMHYMPVNILRGAVGPGTGEPVFTSVSLMPATQVSDSMWNMSIPSGFHMGTLPAKP